MSNRRVVAIGLLGLLAAALTGCMTKPLQPVRDDGTYCFGYGRAYRQLFTCTTDPVPSPTVEAEVKQFQADPSALTVYVIRRRWNDANRAIPLVVDNQAPITTVPRSLVRLRLRPGVHLLSAAWDNRLAGFRVFGGPGEVQYIELNGMQWAWRTDYWFEPASADDAQVQAVRSKLIADVSVVR